MVKWFRRKVEKPGLSPGTLIKPEKEEKKVQPKITLIRYDESNCEMKEIKNLEDILPLKDKNEIIWINIDGVYDTKLLNKMGDSLHVHPLVLEDITNIDQRPKIEDYQNYLYIVLKMIHYDEKNRELSIEQINLILGDKYIISLQERVGDIFQSIRDRIKLGTGRIRKMGSDYLAYALMDAIVDNYFITLEKIGEDIEELEAELIENATTETLRKLHRLKREIIVLRRSVWPIREIINRFQRTESKLVTDVIDIFLRDVYDHSIQIMEIIESSRDILSGMIDIYLSSISNRMNEVMKVLTIIATIFIPLTLVAGIYGMNFSFMPELNWVFGYPLILISMLIVGIIMLIYFRKKKWI